jgi:plastocyanin
MQRRILVLIAAALLSLGLAACGSSSKSSSSGSNNSNNASASGTAGITIDSSFKFNVTPVKAGSTVTIKNDSSSNHTVTSNQSGLFDVALDANGTATIQAPTKPGDYPFHCKIHSFMTGTLTVT